MCVMLAAAGAAAGAAGGMGGLGAIMGIAQAGLGIMGALSQHQAKQQAYAEQVRQIQEAEDNAQEALNRSVAEKNLALQSEASKSQGEMADVAIEANARKSTQRVVSAERGVQGTTTDHLVYDIMGKKARYDGKHRYNMAMGTANAESSLKMEQLGHKSRLAAMPRPEKISFAPTAVNIGSSLVSGFGTAYRYSRKT